MTGVRLLLVALLAVVAGCSRQDPRLTQVPAADQALALYYVDQLRARNFDAIDRGAIPSVRGPRLYDALLKMVEALPDNKDAPTSRQLVGAQVSTSPEGATTSLVFEYDFSGKWVLANVALLRKPDAVSLVALSVRAIPESLEERHRFRLAGKSPVHYVVLALAILFPLLTLYALIACARTKRSWTKMLWVLFILFGIGSFSINWTTGETLFSPYAIRLFGLSVASVLYGPWFLSVSFPLGAVAFLVRRALTARAPKP
ncbi:MAG: hypothetical protein ABI640_14175 [Gammaproteobacteria bacterium]